MDRALDRLQRAVAGWVGPVVYALPILEVWLLARMGDHGADALLVFLQVCWLVALAVVLGVALRRGRTPAGEAEVEPRPPRDSSQRPAGRPVSRRRGDH